MDIRYSGRNVRVTNGIKTHVEDKLHKYEKIARHLVDAHVILKKENFTHKAEITLLAKNFKAYGEAKSKKNLFVAIDNAYSKVEKQLKKYREKRKKDHHRRETKDSVLAQTNKKRRSRVIEEEPPSDEGPVIVKSSARPPKPMSVGEASMQLHLSDEQFLVFLNSGNKKVNIIFKRDDGNHGLVEHNF